MDKKRKRHSVQRKRMAKILEIWKSLAPWGASYQGGEGTVGIRLERIAKG